MPESATRALRQNRDFGRLWIGQAISGMGSQITGIATPLLALALTHSPAKAGLIGVARSIAYPLAMLPAGVLADRLDRRRMMIVCATGRMAATASIPIALALGRPTLAQLLAASLIDAVLLTASGLAERGMIAQLVPAEALGEAITVNEGRYAAAMVAGPPAGGALFGIARTLPFVADAASYLAVLAALLRLHPHAPQEPPGLDAPRAAVGAQIAEGLRWLAGRPFLRDGALLYAAANMILAAISLLALLIARRHGASSAAVGGAFAIIGAGALIGAALANPLRRRISGRAAVLIEPWFYVIFIPLLLIAHSPVAIGLVVAATMLPLILSSSVLVGRRLALAPDHLRGRVMASAGFVGSALTWIGPLAIGFLYQYAGEDATILALSGVCLLVALAATLARGFREVPAAP